MRALSLLVATGLAFGSLAACSGDDGPPADTVAFDLDGPLAGTTYWELPFPSDLRLTADGRPDLDGFPNRRNLPVLADLLSVARERAGFPVMPIAWFKFTAAAPQRALDQVIPAATTAEALLVDIDPSSDERGALHALVAQTLPEDDFTGSGLVAIAPRPGTVLRAHTRYAFVLTRAFSPATEVPPAFAALTRGETPPGARGAAAAALYAPLWDTLDTLGVARDAVLVATVFTTGDEVAVLRQRSEAIRTTTHATITNLRVDPVDGAAHDGFCELIGDVTFPQYQTGTAPFGTGGRFVLDAAGVPIAQGMMTVPLAITLPNGTMPRAAGRCGSSSMARAAPRSTSSTTAPASPPRTSPRSARAPATSSPGAASPPPRARSPSTPSACQARAATRTSTSTTSPRSRSRSSRACSSSASCSTPSSASRSRPRSSPRAAASRSPPVPPRTTSIPRN